MTIVRNLALKISAAVVKYSSPGCKDWAEGLLQETALIENDLSALGWALGSTRVLLDRREAPIGSISDVSVLAQKFVEAQRNGTGIWLYMSLQTFMYVQKFFDAKVWLEHVGCAVVVLGSLSIAIASFLERRRLNALMRTDIEDEVLFYKSELQRSLEIFPRGVFMISFFVYIVGLMISQRGGVDAHRHLNTFLGVVSLVGVLLFVHTRRLNQRRLERLNALLTD